MTAPTDAETQTKRRAALRARQKPTVFEAPGPAISDKAVADMSAVVSALAGLFPDLADDPADWATCDEHETTYLIGEACPECVIADLAAQLDTTPADLLEHAAESVRAPTETPILTTEQARGLASRWAWWEAKKAEQPESWMYISAGPAPLLDPEREQLCAWVRARMANTRAESSLLREDMVSDVSYDLWGPGDDRWSDAVWALCKAAGWPS